MVISMSNDASSDTEMNHVAEIEMLYQQRMTVRIPVREMPANPESAFHLVKNADPEFVADVLPSDWDDAVTTGELNVVDILEGECNV